MTTDQCKAMKEDEDDDNKDYLKSRLTDIPQPNSPYSTTTRRKYPWKYYQMLAIQLVQRNIMPHASKTDGSKTSDSVGAAVVHRNKTKCIRQPNTASIISAELYQLPMRS